MSRNDQHAAATTLLEVAQQQHPVKHAAARALQTCDYVASHTPASRCNYRAVELLNERELLLLCVLLDRQVQSDASLQWQDHMPGVATYRSLHVNPCKLLLAGCPFCKPQRRDACCAVNSSMRSRGDRHTSYML
jgi:hypothetical protein